MREDRDAFQRWEMPIMRRRWSVLGGENNHDLNYNDILDELL